MISNFFKATGYEKKRGKSFDSSNFFKWKDDLGKFTREIMSFKIRMLSHLSISLLTETLTNYHLELLI